MGGKSSSSTKTQTTQNVSNTTTQADASGVITGSVFQGEQIYYSQEFGPEVADAFSKLINLTGNALDTASSAGAFAIEAVSQRAERAEQPDTSLARSAIPMVLVASIVVIWLITRKK